MREMSHDHINRFPPQGTGQAKVVGVPTGVAHGIKATCGPVNLFNIFSLEYDPSDEGGLDTMLLP
jgi:hypothetical protein